MKWYQKKIKQDDRYVKWARDISKKRNVRLIIYFKRSSPDSEGGSYTYEDRTIRIYVRNDWTINDFLHCFYHEMMHMYCFDNDIYPNYHIKKDLLSKDEVRSYLRVALKAEQYVEIGAMKLFKKHFPKVPWQIRYHNKRDIKFLNNYLQPFREFLKEGKNNVSTNWIF